MPIYPASTKTSSPDVNLASLNADMASESNPFATKQDLELISVSGVKQKFGLNVSFKDDSFYGTLGMPEAGLSILTSYEGATLGVVNMIFHMAASEPSYPNSFIKSASSQDYVPNALNYIYLMYLGESQVIYKIDQNAT